MNRNQVISQQQQKQTDSPSQKSNHKPGALPSYLIKRKLEWAKAERERLERMESVQVPPGMRLLDENERLDNIKVLKAHQQDLVKQLNKLSITSDTLATTKRRMGLEHEIEQTESSLKLFEKSGNEKKPVFILIDESS